MRAHRGKLRAMSARLALPKLPPILEGRSVRRESSLRLRGVPLVSVAFGADGAERHGEARGWIALGDRARGVLALVSMGGASAGYVSAGGAAWGRHAFSSRGRRRRD